MFDVDLSILLLMMALAGAPTASVRFLASALISMPEPAPKAVMVSVAIRFWGCRCGGRWGWGCRWVHRSLNRHDQPNFERAANRLTGGS